MLRTLLFLFLVGFVTPLEFVWAQKGYYFPARNSDWEKKSASSFKIDESKLQKAVDFAQNNEYSGERDLRVAILKGFSHEPFHKILGPTKKRGGPAGMILKKGYIVTSWGDVDRVDMTFSVTKSFLSTVAGVAFDQKWIASVKDSVKNYVWDGTFDGRHNSSITWETLLNQSSDWSGTLWGSHDWADRPPRIGDIDDWKNREFRTPGTVFEYNDVRVNVLAYSLLHVLRNPLPEVLKTDIMNPIGASSTWRWYGYENSWAVIDGIEMQSVSGGGHSGGGLFINAEDQARFGLLFQTDGKWDGKQIISKEWIDLATKPSSANVNYGFMWWLNKEGPRHWEGIPENVFYAAGFGGNFIVILPDQEMVIVTRWLEPNKIGEFMKLVFDSL